MVRKEMVIMKFGNKVVYRFGVKSQTYDPSCDRIDYYDRSNYPKRRSEKIVRSKGF